MVLELHTTRKPKVWFSQCKRYPCHVPDSSFASQPGTISPKQHTSKWRCCISKICLALSATLATEIFVALKHPRTCITAQFGDWIQSFFSVCLGLIWQRGQRVHAEHQKRCWIVGRPGFKFPQCHDPCCDESYRIYLKKQRAGQSKREENQGRVLGKSCFLMYINKPLIVTENSPNFPVFILHSWTGVIKTGYFLLSITLVLQRFFF